MESRARPEQQAQLAAIALREQLDFAEPDGG